MVQYKAFKGMYYIFLFYCLKKKITDCYAVVRAE